MSSGATDGMPPLGDPGLIPLRRLAFTMLPPSMSRRRRARLADTVARDALRGSADHEAARTAVVHAALHAGRGGLPIPGLPTLGGAAGPMARATERALAAMVPATRAAFALLHLEYLSAAKVTAVLADAGVHDPQTAVTLAKRTPLEPSALRSLVVPVPSAATRPQLRAAGVGVLVVAVAAPVLAAAAFGQDDNPAPVATVVTVDAERDAAVRSAEMALREARAREASQSATAAATADADRSLARIQRRLDSALDRPGATRKETKRLKALRSAVKAERARLKR